jgi:hypothetical protein
MSAAIGGFGDEDETGVGHAADDAFGQREDEDPNYVAVGGLCERVYVPYDVAFGVWQWAFYMVPWRPFIYEQATGLADIPDMTLRVYLDGVELPAFRRYMSVSAETEAQTFGSVPGSIAGPNHEQVTPLWFDSSKLATSVSNGVPRAVGQALAAARHLRLDDVRRRRGAGPRRTNR